MIQQTDFNLSVSGMSVLGKTLWHLLFIWKKYFTFQQHESAIRGKTTRQIKDLHNVGHKKKKKKSNHSTGHTAWSPWTMNTKSTHTALWLSKFLLLLTYSLYHFIFKLTWILWQSHILTFALLITPFTTQVSPAVHSTNRRRSFITY